MLITGAICGGAASREQNVLRALLAELGHPEIVPRKAQWRQRHCDQNPQVTNEAASRVGATRGWQQSLSYPSSGRPPRGGLNQSQHQIDRPRALISPVRPESKTKTEEAEKHRRSLARTHAELHT